MKSTDIPPTHILIIDDDESILDAVSLLLSDFGYHVDTISRGEEARVKVPELLPNIILLDVLMSGVDGRDICKSLKQDEKTKHIPIIMLSAHPGVSKNMSEYGADGFLSKPFEIDDLLKTIEKFVQQ